MLIETKVLDHGFVRLIDTMPQVQFCGYVPEDWYDEHDDEDTYCHRAGVVLTSSQFTGGDGFWCDAHAPEDKEMPPWKEGAKPRWFIDDRDVQTAPGDQRIVDAARVSIAGGEVRPTSDNRKLIRYLVKNKHTTPLEQVRFTFHARMPLFVARQWIRHRTGSFNEESARYGKLAGDFYIPSLERVAKGGQAKKNKQGSGADLNPGSIEFVQQQVKEHSQECYDFYEQLLDIGLARELARMVLPLNIYTQWYWTTDLHNLMHFLKLRLHPHAQWEFRQYAEAIIPMAEAVAPYAMEAFRDFVLETQMVPK